jgi:hypothetical protein
MILNQQAPFFLVGHMYSFVPEKWGRLTKYYQGYKHFHLAIEIGEAVPQPSEA